MNNFTGKVYVCIRIGSRTKVQTIMIDDELINSDFEFDDKSQVDKPPKYIKCKLKMTAGRTAHCKICVGDFVGIRFNYIAPNELVRLHVSAQMVAFCNISDLAKFMDSVR